MKNKNSEWSVLKSCDFFGDIVITDPCYLRHGLDNKTNIDWMDLLEAILAKGGIESRTHVGDWGCTVFKIKKGTLGISSTKRSSQIGKFCADAGMVCVVKLADVLAFNPDFEKWTKESNSCATIIRGFAGTVKFITKTEKRRFGDGTAYNHVELRVHGEGMKDGKPFCFESVQTSL